MSKKIIKISESHDELEEIFKTNEFIIKDINELASYTKKDEFQKIFDEIEFHRLLEIICSLTLYSKNFYNLLGFQIFIKNSGYDCIFLKLNELDNNEKSFNIVLGEIKSKKFDDDEIVAFNDINKINEAYNDIFNKSFKCIPKRICEISQIANNVLYENNHEKPINSNLKDNIKKFFKIDDSTKISQKSFFDEIDYIVQNKISKNILLGTANVNDVELTKNLPIDKFNKIYIVHITGKDLTYKKLKTILKKTAELVLSKRENNE